MRSGLAERGGKQAVWESGLEKAEIDAFIAEAAAGDYDHLLQTVMRWFDVI